MKSMILGMCVGMLAAGIVSAEPTIKEAKPTAEAAWNTLVGEKQLRQLAYAYVKNDPGLPNVLIYGDSISIGYTHRVREKLAGKANVYRLHCNGGDSASVIDKVTVMERNMRNKELEDAWTFSWDVIQVNVGLHDLKYVKDGRLVATCGAPANSEEAYAANLKQVVSFFERLAPDAKLIFATTTPVPSGSVGRVEGDAKKYNAVALEVLKAFPNVQVNDLYGFTLPNQKVWWTQPGNVHFNATGKNAQGDEVARVIGAAL